MKQESKWAYTIEIKLIKGEGVCPAGHKIGDTWVFPGDTEQIRCEKGICIHALASMLPKIVAMRYGAQLPWLKENPDVATHMCPDAVNPHVFEIRRLRA
jgi:uncharacterized repeat protein (TIGR04076 family)